MNTQRAPLMHLTALAALLLLLCGTAQAKIDGIPGNTFNLRASDGYIYTGEGNAIYVWGFGDQAGYMQYPGPTLIVRQGQTVQINLDNSLNEPVSIVIPGFQVTATGGTEGPITREAAPNGTVSYSFVADKPGTFIYQSGSNPALQIEMGLSGTLIVRPVDFDPINNRIAYPGVEYDHEYLYFHSEMDYRIHELVEFGQNQLVDQTTYFPYYWFYNGRTSPDVWSDAGVPWLPSQPYNCAPRMHPNEKMLLRVVGGGRDPHPFHHHGNNGLLVARDGMLLASAPDAGPDLGVSRFTQTIMPGGTLDVIFDPWKGAELGWDVHDHAITDAMKDYESFGSGTLARVLTPAQTVLTVPPALAESMPQNRQFRAVIWTGASLESGQREVVILRRRNNGLINGNVGFHILKRSLEGTTALRWGIGANVTATYHGAPFPVTLPDQKDLTFGFMYSGSPFLGAMGQLPPGEGGFNVNNGLAFMFHSHNEKEMTNNDIFPGGMMSMMIVEPEGVEIEQNLY